MSDIPGVSNQTVVEITSMAMPIVEFVPLQVAPSDLGASAHARLEELFGRPIASQDAQPEVADEKVGQRAGQALGSLVGRQRWFVENLDKIEGELNAAAEAHGVDILQVEDTLTDILRGSGIGKAMHRTLDRPFQDRRDALDYVRNNAQDGVVLLHRGAIGNWAGTRQELMMGLVAGLPESVLQSIRGVIYAGSAQRQYKAPTELWRPEVRPFVRVEVKDDKEVEVTDLTEASIAEKVYLGQAKALLGHLGVEDTLFDVVSVDSLDGNAVMRGVLERHGELLRNSLVLEVGNAPAGYIQMNDALLTAQEVSGFDPTTQFVGITNSVEMVTPRGFAGLRDELKSRHQDARTGLNSLNAWLSTVISTNRYVLNRRQGQ